MSSCGFNTHTWSWGQNMSMNQQETHSKKSDSTAQPSGKVREGRNRPSLRLTLTQKQKLKKCHKWATCWFPVNNWWPYWEEPKIPLQGNASKGFRRPEKSVSCVLLNDRPGTLASLPQGQLHISLLKGLQEEGHDSFPRNESSSPCLPSTMPAFVLRALQFKKSAQNHLTAGQMIL